MDGHIVIILCVEDHTVQITSPRIPITVVIIVESTLSGTFKYCVSTITDVGIVHSPRTYAESDEVSVHTS